MVRLDLPRIYFDIFSRFNGALDHLLIRTQFSLISGLDLLSGATRLLRRLNASRLREKNRRLSLPVLLSTKDRLFSCIAHTSQHRPSPNDDRIIPDQFEFQ